LHSSHSASPLPTHYRGNRTHTDHLTKQIRTAPLGQNPAISATWNGFIFASLHGEIMNFCMGGPEHVHLAGARFQLPSRWSVYCDFLDVWPHSSSTTYLYTIYKFDSSIDSATQGLLTASLAARRNQLPLCCDTKHVAQGTPCVLSVKYIRFKPLDPVFQNLCEILHRNGVSVFLLTPYTDY
jgi:hypothetical protein